MTELTKNQRREAIESAVVLSHDDLRIIRDHLTDTPQELAARDHDFHQRAEELGEQLDLLVGDPIPALVFVAED